MDPNSTYHPDADPDSDFLFHTDRDPTFRPDADPDLAYLFDADPDFYSMRMRIHVTKMMRIRIRIRIRNHITDNNSTRVPFWKHISVGMGQGEDDSFKDFTFIFSIYILLLPFFFISLFTYFLQ